MVLHVNDVLNSIECFEHSGVAGVEEGRRCCGRRNLYYMSVLFLNLFPNNYDTKNKHFNNYCPQRKTRVLFLRDPLCSPRQEATALWGNAEGREGKTSLFSLGPGIN